jgi:MoaA/NifB/PqqE/SkfB family radical SAM enzyme
MKGPRVILTKDKRLFLSKDYNFSFDLKTGLFARWGSKLEDDPTMSPYGPEILDIEVTTICTGNCPFCYKGNTKDGENMSLDTFKSILDRMPKLLTQIAFGADARGTSNPDLFKMMEYAREKSVVPNITVANIDDTVADNLARLCGAVAVSRYSNKNQCYDSIKKLTDRGMTQVNIHVMVSEETYDMVMETLQDRLTDPRLAKLNAIVMLSLKQKGRGTQHHCLDPEKFRSLVDFALDKDIGIGFDSCSAHKFLTAIKDHPGYKDFEQMVEPCESSVFSSYINVKGEFYPCSFTEGTEGWETGIDVSKVESFLKDVWHNERVVAWRTNLLGCGRSCPIYKI